VGSLGRNIPRTGPGSRLRLRGTSKHGAQKKLSAPSFRVAAAYGWDARTGTWSTEQSYNADVYVFCLHTATAHDEYDPLQVSQWRFYVANRSAIATQGGSRMGLVTLQRSCGDPVTYPALPAAIAAAASSALQAD
jgi:hypothetical protein